MPDADALLALVGGTVLLGELIALVRRYPMAGLWMFFAAAVASTFTWYPAISFAGYQVYALDLVSITLVGVVALRSLSGRVPLGAIWLLIAVFGFAVLRGISAYGPQEAVNASRLVLYVVVAVVFARCWAAAEVWLQLERMWAVAAAALIAVALLFLVRNGLGTYSASGERALNAAQAMIVAQAGLLLLGGSGRVQRRFALLCFAIVLLTQQRTVWAATLAAGVVLAFVGAPSRTRARRSIRQGLIAAALGVILALMFGPGELRQSLASSASTVSTESGTFGWRIDGWLDLLRQYGMKPALDKIIGQPFGAGFARGENSALIVSPHNMYLTILISLGVAGLVAFGAVMAAAIRRSPETSPALRSLLAGLVVFGIGYQLAPEQGLFIGVALASAAAVPTRVVERLYA